MHLHRRRIEPAFRLNPLAAPLVRARVLLLPGLLAPALTLANPVDGTVVAGQASIEQISGLTTIQQQSGSAIINWQDFNIGAGETVNFLQPSASAAVLNRVIGGDLSTILGNLNANGRVLLINPQGVIFGQGAKVDVGGLVASTLDIANEDFMAGRYVLAGTASAAGVVNDGALTARDGGFVVLAGGNVRNGGLIQTRFGDVVLASGSALTLDLNDTGLVSYRIDSAAIGDAAGVTNTGDLMADGGRVFMAADVAQGLAATAVNNSGLVRAARVEEIGGEIVLSAAGGGIVNRGRLDASGLGGQGGNILVRGSDDVSIVEGAVLDVSGTRGGSARIIAAQDALFAEGASLSAHGSGLFSGGFVELSGHDDLKVRGTLAVGHGGTLLIDPQDLTIANGSGNTSSATIFEQTLESQLAGGTNVVLTATRKITLGNLSDNRLDGRSGNVSTPGGSLTLGIGNVDGSGAYVRGAGEASGGIAFTDLNDSILVDGALNLTSGSTAGNGGISTGSLTAGSILLRSADNILTGNVTSTSTTAPFGVQIYAPEIRGNNITAVGNIDVGGEYALVTQAGGFQYFTSAGPIANVTLGNLSASAVGRCSSAVSWKASAAGTAPPASPPTSFRPAASAPGHVSTSAAGATSLPARC